MSADASEVGPYPANYREIAVRYLRQTLLDPYTVRDAQISKPKMGKLFTDTMGVSEAGWLVCFRANAKNRMGAYTGITDMVLAIRGNEVKASLGDPGKSHYVVRTTCATEAYDPFPEMEKPSMAR